MEEEKGETKHMKERDIQAKAWRGSWGALDGALLVGLGGMVEQPPSP